MGDQREAASGSHLPRRRTIRSAERKVQFALVCLGGRSLFKLHVTMCTVMAVYWAVHFELRVLTKLFLASKTIQDTAETLRVCRISTHEVRLL